MFTLFCPSSDSRASSSGTVVDRKPDWVVSDNLTFSFSWIHDLSTHYRMASDYFYLNTYISF
jgi:hypothetical protein